MEREGEGEGEMEALKVFGAVVAPEVLEKVTMTLGEGTSEVEAWGDVVKTSELDCVALGERELLGEGVAEALRHRVDEAEGDLLWL